MDNISSPGSKPYITHQATSSSLPSLKELKETEAQIIALFSKLSEPEKRKAIEAALQVFKKTGPSPNRSAVLLERYKESGVLTEAEAKTVRQIFEDLDARVASDVPSLHISPKLAEDTKLRVLEEALNQTRTGLTDEQFSRRLNDAATVYMIMHS